MKKNNKDLISLILIIIAAIILIIFEFVNLEFSGDELTDNILKDVIVRFIVVAILLIMLLFYDRKILKVNFRRLPLHFLWCIPCFLVVFANFPLTALINGTATVLRPDLICLFIIDCIAVGLMEELLFRGLLQPTIYEYFKKHTYGILITTAITSAVFALFHLLNLFSGAAIGAVLLQVGYSFLIGAMLSAVLFKTNNIWLCVILHSTFNIGGNIIPQLGSGLFQDTCFWIFTAIAGVICTLHILYYLINQKNKNGN